MSISVDRNVGLEVGAVLGEVVDLEAAHTLDYESQLASPLSLNTRDLCKGAEGKELISSSLRRVDAGDGASIGVLSIIEQLLAIVTEVRRVDRQTSNAD
jgi:hypothetical protein